MKFNNGLFETEVSRVHEIQDKQEIERCDFDCGLIHFWGVYTIDNYGHASWEKDFALQSDAIEYAKGFGK